MTFVPQNSIGVTDRHQMTDRLSNPDLLHSQMGYIMVTMKNKQRPAHCFMNITIQNDNSNKAHGPKGKQEPTYQR